VTVQQGGVITPGHVASWAIDGVVQDAGTATEPKVNSLGLYGNGGTPLGITNSEYAWPFYGAYTTMGFGVSQTAAYTSVFGTQDLPYQIIVNGVVQATFGPNGAEFTLASPLLPADGGTGLSATPAAGQLLIGNGTGYTLATLTAGLNTSIANTPGGITISSGVGPSGVLPVGSGGTGATTLTGFVFGNGTAALTTVASTGTGNVVLASGATLTSATLATHGTVTFAP